MVAPGTDVLVTGVGVSVKGVLIEAGSVTVTGRGEASRVGKGVSVATAWVGASPVRLGTIPVLMGLDVVVRL